MASTSLDRSGAASAPKPRNAVARPNAAFVAAPPVESEREQGDAGDGDDQVEQARVAERHDHVPGSRPRCGACRRPPRTRAPTGSGCRRRPPGSQATTLRTTASASVHGPERGRQHQAAEGRAHHPRGHLDGDQQPRWRGRVAPRPRGQRGGDRRVGRGPGRDREGRRDDREPDVVDGDRDRGRGQEGQPRGVRRPDQPVAPEPVAQGSRPPTRAGRTAPSGPLLPGRRSTRRAGPRRTGPRRARAATATAARWRDANA